MSEQQHPHFKFSSLLNLDDENTVMVGEVLIRLGEYLLTLLLSHCHINLPCVCTS